jgi:hypothetical protein
MLGDLVAEKLAPRCSSAWALLQTWAAVVAGTSSLRVARKQQIFALASTIARARSGLNRDKSGRAASAPTLA